MRRLFGVIVSVFVVASLCACTDYAQEIQDEYGPDDSSGKDGVSGEMTDYRDGQVYKAVTIGGKAWMVENLRYEVAPSYCLSSDEDDLDLCENGWLYTWDAAMQACPSGWHVPSIDEWHSFFDSDFGKELMDRMLEYTPISDRSMSYWTSDEMEDAAYYVLVDDYALVPKKSTAVSVRCVQD